MKQQDKAKLGRRDFLRAMGAGAGLAVTAAAPLVTEAAAAEIRRGQEEGPLQGNRSREGLLQGQPFSELAHDSEKWKPVFGKDHAQI